MEIFLLDVLPVTHNRQCPNNTQVTNFNQRPGFVLCLSTAGVLREGALLHLCCFLDASAHNVMKYWMVC